MPYIPIEEFIETDSDQSSNPIRDFPSGKSRYSLNIFPTELTFASLAAGQVSPAQTIILVNSGYDDILINSISAVGNFALSGAIPTKIEVGDSVGIQVTYNPIGLANDTGGIYIDTGNAAGKEFIKLIGSGLSSLGSGYNIIKANNIGAGSANYIEATTELPIPGANGRVLIALNIVVTNTASPVVVSFNEDTAIVIKNSQGNDVGIGDLPVGAIVIGYKLNGTFRLLIDDINASLLAIITAEGDRAEVEADRAETAANKAEDLFDNLIIQSLVPIFSTQNSITTLTLPDFNAIRTNGLANARDKRAATLAFSETEPNHYGKVKSFNNKWFEEVSRELTHDVFRSNTLWLPDINAELVGGPTASPGGTPNYFNVFIAPGGAPLNNLANTIYRSTGMGHAGGQSAYSWERVEFFGNRALGFAEMADRVVAIGTLALQWLGSRSRAHLEATFHDWWLASNNGPPGSLLWDFQGMETRNPGIGALIQAFTDYPTIRDDVSGIISVGRDSGLHMVKGGSSVFVGYQAAANAFSVDAITAIGDRALRDGVFLTQTVGIGNSAGLSWQTGTRNLIGGYIAGSQTIRGSYNVILGPLAALTVTDMTSSVILGYQAGQGIGTNLANVLAIQVGAARLPLISGKFDLFRAGININPANIKGTLHVRSADSGVITISSNGDELLIENNTHAGMTIMTPNTSNGYIYFADPESPNVGYMYYSHADNTMRIGRNGAVALSISPTGMGFNGTAAITKPTGVAVTAAAIHAALVSYGLIAA